MPFDGECVASEDILVLLYPSPSPSPFPSPSPSPSPSSPGLHPRPGEEGGGGAPAPEGKATHEVHIAPPASEMICSLPCIRVTSPPLKRLFALPAGIRCTDALSPGSHSVQRAGGVASSHGHCSLGSSLRLSSTKLWHVEPRPPKGLISNHSHCG